MTSETKKFRIKVIILVILYTVLVSVAAFLLTPIFWPFGFFTWLMVVAFGGLLLVVRWLAKNTAYVWSQMRSQIYDLNFNLLHQPSHVEEKTLEVS